MLGPFFWMKLGTDTSGPGEAVLAINFDGKPHDLLRIEISEPGNKQKIR